MLIILLWLSFIIKSTTERTFASNLIETPQKQVTSPIVDDLVISSLPALYIPDVNEPLVKGVDNRSLDNVWCEAKAYRDLSSHYSIRQFQEWTDQLRSIVCLTENNNCSDHDPRFLHQFFKIGEKLAVARKPIF